MKFKGVFYTIILCLFQACISEKEDGKSGDSLSRDSIVERVETSALIEAPAIDTFEVEEDYDDSVSLLNDTTQFDITSAHATKLKYANFSVIFHGFYSYTIENSKGESMHEPNEYEHSGFDYKGTYNESLIINTDTVILDEDLDERINNTLIQIVSKNKNDKFVITAGYLTRLNELIDYRNFTQEEAEHLYENAESIMEKTNFLLIRDSARYFFRAFPHTADMEEVTVKDGKWFQLNQVTLKNKTMQKKSFIRGRSIELKASMV